MCYGSPKPYTSRTRLIYSKPCFSFWFFLKNSPKLETLGTPITTPWAPDSQVSPESYLSLCLLFPHSFHHRPVTLTFTGPLTHTYSSCLPKRISYELNPRPLKGLPGQQCEDEPPTSMAGSHSHHQPHFLLPLPIFYYAVSLQHLKES